MGRKPENVVPENPRSYFKKENCSTMANTTEKPSEVRMNLLLASTLVGFKSSFRIVKTMVLLETRKQEGSKGWQGEDGSKKFFCV